MKFALTRPCDMCPFRSDCLQGWLGRERADEIKEAVFGLFNGPFPCHKTVDYDAEDGGAGYNSKTQHCAGALILMEKLERRSDCAQIAERVGARYGFPYDPGALQMDAPVFDSLEEFVNHHGKR